MEGKRYNIDLQDSTKTGNILKAVLGLFSAAAAVWFFMGIKGTEAATATSWIAVAFLGLFSLYMLLSSFGLTDRYIVIGEDRMTVRINILRPPVTFTPNELKRVDFVPLAIHFTTSVKKIRMKLGTYYPAHTAAVSEAVASFCERNGIETTGLEKEQ